MSLKGPEVSLDAAHRDPGSSSTYVAWFEKKGPHPFLAVHDSSIGDLVTHSVSESETFDYSDW